MSYLKKLKFLSQILIFGFVSLLLSSCFDSKEEHKWVIGTSADNPPYEFMQDGKIVGFDIDLITELAKRLNKTLEFKNMEFHGLLAALSSSNVDLVIAGLSITPERLERVDFSASYTSAKIAFLYKTAENFKSALDLKGKVVGAQLGTIWSLAAHDLSVEGGFKVVTLSSNLMLVEDLKSDRVDAVVLEDAQGAKFMSIYPNLSKFVVEDLRSSFAIALPKGSANKQIIDEAIEVLKKDGTIDALKQKWEL